MGPSGLAGSGQLGFFTCSVYFNFSVSFDSPFLKNDLSFFIGFDNDSLSKSVQERSSPNQVTLRVIRRFGLRGGSRIHWEARLSGVLASNDITPVEGHLVFAQGESSHNIVFDVQPDSVPEVLEVRFFY